MTNTRPPQQRTRRGGLSRHRWPLKRPLRVGVRAFTLLELLVAMAMCGILAISLYASLRIGFRAKAAAEAQLDPARSIELSMESMRMDLQAAPAPTGLFAGSFEGTTGSDDRGHDDADLQFFSVTDSPQHVDGNGEVKSIELTVMTTPGGDHALVRKVVRNLLSQQAMNPDIEIIARGVASFSLQYYNGSAWADTWDSTQEDNTLPAAVQVTVSMDPRQATTSLAQPPTPKTYVRIFQLPCSTAATDTTVNPSAGSSL